MLNGTQKHIVFDWNSTLLDDFPIIHECVNLVLKDGGKEAVTLDYFRTCYDVPFETLYANLGLTGDELKKVVNFDRNVFHRYYEPRADQALLRDGAEEILKHATEKGVRSYILSNHIVEPIRNQLRRLKIDHHFAEVLAYANEAVQFKDMTKGERLRRYIAEKNIKGHPTIIVGDSVEEIHIGKAEGLITVAITGGGGQEERLRNEKPDYVIHSLPELKAILQDRGFA